MSKYFYKIVAITLLTAIFVLPPQITAADNAAGNGVYLTKAGETSRYYTLDQWAEVVNKSEHIALTNKYGVANIKIVFSNKVADIVQLSNTSGDFMKASSMNKEANEVLEGSYIKTDGSLITIISNAADEFSVESII